MTTAPSLSLFAAATKAGIELFDPMPPFARVLADHDIHLPLVTMSSAFAVSHIPEIAPDRQAPAEYLKHPGLFAATETERSEPPMMAPAGSNGDDGPRSTKKPFSFSVLI